MCSYTDIKIGTVVTIKVMFGSCLECGEILVYNGLATYRGHQIVDGCQKDVFALSSPTYCECGKKLAMYSEECGNGGLSNKTTVRDINRVAPNSAWKAPEKELVPK